MVTLSVVEIVKLSVQIVDGKMIGIVSKLEIDSLCGVIQLSALSCTFRNEKIYAVGGNTGVDSKSGYLEKNGAIIIVNLKDSKLYKDLPPDVLKGKLHYICVICPIKSFSNF